MFGFCYFFFQAEDGIRDGHVTGVQTCALPISLLWTRVLKRIAAILAIVPLAGPQKGAPPKKLLSLAPHRWCGSRVRIRGRSEERRVGKEFRFRGLMRQSLDVYMVLWLEL